MNQVKRLSMVEWPGDLAKFEQSVNNACLLIEKTGGTVLSIKVIDELDIRNEANIFRAAIVYLK